MIYKSELYMHELDRKAFDALNNFPKFVKFREAYMANVDEKIEKINNLSTAIRLSENQMPEVYSLLPPICAKLGISIPDLYFVQSKEMNAWTFGTTEPYICVTSALIEKVPLELVASVIAHECGHIACQHTLYHSMAVQLLNGIDNSPLSRIPAIRKYITPTLVNAILFWYRCSELSADRAAVLCDGAADKTVDMLLRIHGYENINRDEFLKQALDLKAFVEESQSNKMLEQMLVRGNSHPRLATRAYECFEWTKTRQYEGILNGTYSSEKAEEKKDDISEEVVSAEVNFNVQPGVQNIDLDKVNARLAQINKELVRYTNTADKADYAFAIFSGIMAGFIDSVFVGETIVSGNDIGLSHKQVNNFIQEYAKARGFEEGRLKDAISDLEGAFKVAQDNVWKGAGINVSAKNHHLADLAHHPTPIGLASSIIVQFLRVGSFVNKNGEWHFLLVKTDAKDVIESLAPAMITGILNWLVAIAEKKIENSTDFEIPDSLKKLTHLVASTPLIFEVAKCADNWFGHLVSDMGGSKNTAGAGMGIPGVFISLLYEVAALPGINNTGLAEIVDDLYQNKKLDMRHELAYCHSAGKQIIPVAFNEIYIRLGYFVSRLCGNLGKLSVGQKADWSEVIPFKNRTVDRMLAIASMTFNVADTADAAVHAAIESGGNWVLFSGKFVARYNYVGAGRAVIAIVKEVSNEKKETQLIHEKMLLSEAKTAVFLSQLHDFETSLEEKVSNYLAEDIEGFMEGLDSISEGLAVNNSDMVISGNVRILKVLGREPQFTSQEEFDELMESDIPLKL